MCRSLARSSDRRPREQGRASSCWRPGLGVPARRIGLRPPQDSGDAAVGMAGVAALAHRTRNDIVTAEGPLRDVGDLVTIDRAVGHRLSVIIDASSVKMRHHRGRDPRVVGPHRQVAVDAVIEGRCERPSGMSRSGKNGLRTIGPWPVSFKRYHRTFGVSCRLSRHTPTPPKRLSTSLRRKTSPAGGAAAALLRLETAPLRAKTTTSPVPKRRTDLPV